MSANYTKPSIPKGTWRLYGRRVFFCADNQYITRFARRLGYAFTQRFLSKTGAKRGLLGVYRWAFQQIFSKDYGKINTSFRYS